HLAHVLDAPRNVVERVDAERETHAPLRAELIDQQGMLGSLRTLEQERRSAGLHRPVDDLGDLEIRIDLGADAGELALALEQRDPVAQVARRAHASESTYAGTRRLDGRRRRSIEAADPSRRLL